MIREQQFSRRKYGDPLGLPIRQQRSPAVRLGVCEETEVGLRLQLRYGTSSRAETKVAPGGKGRSPNKGKKGRGLPRKCESAWVTVNSQRQNWCLAVGDPKTRLHR